MAAAMEHTEFDIDRIAAALALMIRRTSRNSGGNLIVACTFPRTLQGRTNIECGLSLNGNPVSGIDPANGRDESITLLVDGISDLRSARERFERVFYRVTGSVLHLIDSELSPEYVCIESAEGHKALMSFPVI